MCTGYVNKNREEMTKRKSSSFTYANEFLYHGAYRSGVYFSHQSNDLKASLHIIGRLYLIRFD